MPETKSPHDSELEEQTSKLNEGLKSCHALVSSYRTLLTGDQNSGKPSDDESGGDLDDADLSEPE